MKKSIGERLWMNEVNLHRYHDEITQRHNGNLWHIFCGRTQLQWESWKKNLTYQGITT